MSWLNHGCGRENGKTCTKTIWDKLISSRPIEVHFLFYFYRIGFLGVNINNVVAVYVRRPDDPTFYRCKNYVQLNLGPNPARMMLLNSYTMYGHSIRVFWDFTQFFSSVYFCNIRTLSSNNVLTWDFYRSFLSLCRLLWDLIGPNVSQIGANMS
jgi:hypothetical protein